MPLISNKSKAQAHGAGSDAAPTEHTASRAESWTRTLRRTRWLLRRRLAQLTAGGRWTDRLPESVRANLRWFWLDGLFAQATEAIAVAYIPLFVLALGGNRAQIGWMSALANLSSALSLLPGATLAEGRGRRKRICLAGGAGSRLALLLLALTPIFIPGPAGIYIAIGLAVAREAFANLGLPAWVSLTADLVPLTWRGRYFASRNIAMGLAGMAATLIAGQLITQVGGSAGYSLALGLAFGFGLVSIYSFSQIEEPIVPIPLSPLARGARPSLGRHLRAHPEFIAFCAVTALWNFSLNLAGPFFNIYIVEGLKGSAGVVGLLSVVSLIASLPGQRLFGILADRWGPRRVQLLTGMLIPLLPWAWIAVRTPWHAVPVNVAGGFLWAGYSLASFNFLLTLAPEEERPRYTALYQIITLASLAAGAALGGVIVTAWGYQAIFFLSGVGRFLAALLFARFTRGEKPIVPMTTTADG